MPSDLVVFSVSLQQSIVEVTLEKMDEKPEKLEKPEKELEPEEKKDYNGENEYNDYTEYGANEYTEYVDYQPDPVESQGAKTENLQYF